MPRCPPASNPCAMIASTPRASSHRASSTVVAAEKTFEPHARRRVRRSAGGRPKLKLDAEQGLQCHHRLTPSETIGVATKHGIAAVAMISGIAGTIVRVRGAIRAPPPEAPRFSLQEDRFRLE